MRDVYTMTKRNMRYSIRNLDTFITAIMLPVCLMLLFVFVFGGAINIGGGSYVNYVTPAILLLCIGYCAATTSVSIQIDIQNGIINRFRSMSISRTCVLSGQVSASVVRNAMSAILVVLVALLIGFRPEAGVLHWLLIIALLLCYAIVFTWAALFFGLIAKTAESASMFGVVALFLPYLSSAFVPVETMPRVLQVFANYQPFTPITNALRALSFGMIDKAMLLSAFAWLIGLGLAAYVGSLWAYENKSK